MHIVQASKGRFDQPCQSSAASGQDRTHLCLDRACQWLSEPFQWPSTASGTRHAGTHQLAWTCWCLSLHLRLNKRLIGDEEGNREANPSQRLRPQTGTRNSLCEESQGDVQTPFVRLPRIFTSITFRPNKPALRSSFCFFAPPP